MRLNNIINKEIRNIKNDNLYYIFLFCLALFPTNTKFLYINFFIALFLLLKILLIKKFKLTFSPIHAIFFLFINYLLFLSIIISISDGEIIEELVRNIYYLLLLIIASNTIVTFNRIYLMAKILLIFNFTIQIFQYFKLFNINDYIMWIYGGYWKFLNTTRFTDLQFFRSGSIYLNSNIYSKIAITFLIIFLQNIIFNHKKIDYIYILISIFSIILCGSRIGGVLLFITFIVFFWIVSTGIYRKVLYLFVSVIVSFILIVFIKVRAFNIFNDFVSSSSSLGYKLGVIRNYIFEIDFFNILFGSSPNISIPFDSEIGYLFGWYGVAGLLLFFLIIVFILEKGKNTNNNFFYISFGLMILFNSITGGLILNIKLFPFILSIIYVNKFVNKFQINNNKSATLKINNSNIKMD